MKKFLVVLITILSILLMPSVEAKINLPEKTDHEKVKVYLFWSSTCTNCHNLMKYFANKYQDYTDYFEIVTYQVNSDKNNSSLASTIAKQVGEKPGYVPLVIIGNTYHVLGWDDSLGETIIKEALKAYEDDSYTDIVAKEINDNKLEVTEKSFTEACDLVNIKHGVSAKDKIDTKFVICFIIGVVILGFGGLVILSRKK